MRVICATLIVAGACLAQDTTPTMKFRSVTATIVNTTTDRLPGGRASTKTTSGKYYRDTQGRTRTEKGDRIVIQDPVARVRITLDTTARVARVSHVGQTQGTAGSVVTPPLPPIGPSVTRPRAVREPAVDLGTQVIEGVVARGFRATRTLPVGALYNVVPIQQVAEVWRSAELRLPIMVKTTDSLKGERIEIYRDIVVEAPVDPALFTIPAGFQVIESGSAGPAAAP